MGCKDKKKPDETPEVYTNLDIERALKEQKEKFIDLIKQHNSESLSKSVILKDIEKLK